jgi:hypothetical protein
MSFIRRRLWILVLLPVLLGVDECSESGINQDIKAVVGLDTDSPAQVAGAVMLGKTFGDEGEQQAAEMGSVVQDFRRADHEQKADRAYESKDWATASDEYRQSLSWLDDTPKNAPTKADLQIGLANSLVYQGDVARDNDSARKYYLQSASLYGKLAESGQRPKDAMYYDQAASLYHAGAYADACAAVRKSAAAGGFLLDSLRAKLKAADHPCD